MNNPYAPPTDLDNRDRKLHLETTVRASGRSMKVGMLCGAVAGAIFEAEMRGRWLDGSLALNMAGPGMIFGLGIAHATHRAVANVKRLMLVIFPLFALASFFMFGFMFGLTINLPPVTYLSHWVNMSLVSVPGVLILAIGSWLLARPRSYRRFAAALIAFCLIVGGARVLVEIMLAQNSDVVPVFFSAMFISQTVMFALTGWMLGDSDLRQPLAEKSGVAALRAGQS